jgi:UDP-2,3-diacylglucosamine pyrophosphatase LpxH
LTKLAGIALLLHADVYRTWTALTIRLDARRRRLAGDDVLAYSYCHAAAEMILHRGFDAVIFGHTHNAEHATLPSGVYVNSGNWLRGRTFVDIDRGDVTLRTWDGTGAHEVVAC